MGGLSRHGCGIGRDESIVGVLRQLGETSRAEAAAASDEGDVLDSGVMLALAVMTHTIARTGDDTIRAKPERRTSAVSRVALPARFAFRQGRAVDTSAGVTQAAAILAVAAS
jgi:hypothetical protein